MDVQRWLSSGVDAVADWEAGFAAFRPDPSAAVTDERFATARLEFEQCLELHPTDGPSRLFAERCDMMSATPPGEGWDGVFQMTHK